jgi:hypothetical protein
MDAIGREKKRFFQANLFLNPSLGARIYKCSRVIPLHIAINEGITQQVVFPRQQCSQNVFKHTPQAT